MGQNWDHLLKLWISIYGGYNMRSRFTLKYFWGRHAEDVRCDNTGKIKMIIYIYVRAHFTISPSFVYSWHFHNKKFKIQDHTISRIVTQHLQFNPSPKTIILKKTRLISYSSLYPSSHTKYIILVSMLNKQGLKSLEISDKCLSCGKLRQALQTNTKYCLR